MIGEPSRLGEATSKTDDGGSDDPVALASRARKHQDEQLAAGRNIDIATAVMEVKEQKQ